MTTNNREGDNWGQLLSDFGIEDTIQDENIQPAKLQTAEPTRGVRSESFAEGNTEFEAEDADELSHPREKKSIFSRFPKINFFGTPPDVSLNSVMEEVKSPSLGGRAFTDNKLEKMPISQERTDRQERPERQEKSRREKNCVRESNAWSTVASQIDVLASGGDATDRTEERPTKRVVSSMFDDPIPESEESRALNSLIGKHPRRRETSDDAFLEDGPDFRQRGHRKSMPEERESRGRGSRYCPPAEVDDLPESPFVPIDDDEVPVTRGRGRRGSRYDGNDRGRNYRDREPIRDDVLHEEEWSEIDAALQGRSEPVQRGGRRQRYDNSRYDKRRGQERRDEPMVDREPLDDEGSGIVTVHGNIPSWDEAVGEVIMGNISRHKGHGHTGGDHTGGRSGRRRR